MPVTAQISNISRCSLHDGPGVRTVIYFKGCGLRCHWCHNPETLSRGPEILFLPSKCIGCGRCAHICPQHHVFGENGPVFLRDGCTACGRCATVCPAMALSLCGEEWNIEELFSQIKKDMPYYAASNGGVTFSGGECLLQAEAVAALAKLCHKAGIATAVESALFVPWRNIQSVLPHMDLFYADLKLPNSEKHRRYTGQGNELILENLQRLSECHENIIVRIPVIPGVNDSAEDLEGFGCVLRQLGSGIRQVELLKYNTLGVSKYDAIGKSCTKFADCSQSDEEMKRLCTLLEQACGKPCTY